MSKQADYAGLFLYRATLQSRTTGQIRLSAHGTLIDELTDIIDQMFTLVDMDANGDGISRKRKETILEDLRTTAWSEWEQVISSTCWTISLRKERLMETPK